MPRPLAPSALIILLAFSLTPSLHAQASRLPVKRVVLYKNGVGYFEHSGHVQREIPSWKPLDEIVGEVQL